MDSVILSFCADMAGPDLPIVAVKFGNTDAGTVTVKANRAAGEAQGFQFLTDWGGATSRVVRVSFVNDYYVNGQDRNVYLLGMTINGDFYPHPTGNAMMSTGDNVLIIGKPVDAPPVAVGALVFQDLFDTDTADRWLNFDGQHWPALATQPGTWARCFHYGWPTNGGTSDQAARCLVANKEAQCYEDRGVSITADGLVLTATRDPNNHFNKPWTSGAVVQARRLGQKYGYFEVKASLPSGKGFWPAPGWLLAADDPLRWPPEIDMCEKVGFDSTGKLSDKGYHVGIAGGEGDSWWCSGDTVGLHTYGVSVKSDFCEFFYDGVSVGKTKTPASANCPLYLVLNLAVGGPGSWPGEPDASATTARMIVRSVKVWAPA